MGVYFSWVVWFRLDYSSNIFCAPGVSWGFAYRLIGFFSLSDLPTEVLTKAGALREGVVSLFCLSGDRLNFADCGDPVKHFNESVLLHRHHAVSFSHFKKLDLGGFGNYHFFRFVVDREHFIYADSSLEAGVIAFFTSGGARDFNVFRYFRQVYFYLQRQVGQLRSNLFQFFFGNLIFFRALPANFPHQSLRYQHIQGGRDDGRGQLHIYQAQD